MIDTISETDRKFSTLMGRQAYLRGLISANYSVRIAGPRRSTYVDDYYDEIVCPSFVEVAERVDAMRIAHRAEVPTKSVVPVWDAFAEYLDSTVHFFETVAREKRLNGVTREAFEAWGRAKRQYNAQVGSYVAVKGPAFADPYVWIDRSDGKARNIRELMLLPAHSLRETFRTGGKIAYFAEAAMKWETICKHLDHRLVTAFDPPWDGPVGAGFLMAPTWEFQSHPRYRGSAIDVLTKIREEIRDKQIRYFLSSIDSAATPADRYKAWLDIQDYQGQFNGSFFNSTYAEIAYERFDFELFREVRGRMASRNEFATDIPVRAPLGDIGELTQGLFIR
jgi:hypothetical protein